MVKRKLERDLVTVPAPRPAMHPNLAEVYRSKLASLNEALHDATDGTAALEAARSLIERVVLSPGADGAGLEIELTGEIAAMLVSVVATALLIFTDVGVSKSRTIWPYYDR